MKLAALAGVQHPLVPYYLRQRQRRSDPVPVAGALLAFLGEADVIALLAAPEAADWRPAWLEMPGGLRDLVVVVEQRSFAVESDIAGLHQRLTAAVVAALANPPVLRLVVLGNGCAEFPLRHDLDGCKMSPLDAMIAAAADLVFEVKRRADDHFRRHPLWLASGEAASLHMLPAEAVAEFLVTQAAALAPGVHLLRAGPLCSRSALLAAVADEAQIPTLQAGTQPADALAELMRQEMQHACEIHLGGAVGQPAVGPPVQVHELPAACIDWRHRVKEVVQARRALQRDSTAGRWADAPGVRLHRAADGTRWLQCGTGPQVLFLVNAFGLALDFWRDLADSLGRRFTVLALDDSDSPTLPRTYYATPDSLQHFIAAVRTALDWQGVHRCHVASWCSGAKFAIELARAMPEAVASLSLFAPSFAGAQGHAGSDSPFEASLHKMCEVVERLPQSAASMAKSMTAMLSKGGSGSSAPGSDDSGAAVFELADSAQLPWLHQPFSSAACMAEYSRQVMHFRRHQLAPLPHGGRLAQPVLLVTGQRDIATCSLRARDVCMDLCDVLHVELRGASHYFIGQNHRLVAKLLCDFVDGGLQSQVLHPRFTRVAAPVEQHLVSGEI